MKHYLNNAGAAQMSAATRQVIESHLQHESEEGAYQAAQNAKPAMDNFYALAAKIVSASSPAEIAYMDSASRAWNMALYGLALRPGDVIITLASEFGTNLVSLYHLVAKTGAKVHVVECDQDGGFDIREIEAALAAGARVVALSQVAAHGAIVNPVVEIGRLAKKHGALYLVDGCQAVGQMDVNVNEIGCDVYTATGRKWLRGPRGTGFLYVRPAAPIETPQVDLASADLVFGADRSVKGIEIRKDARRFELWERNVAGMLGLANALDEYLKLDRATAIGGMRRAARRIRAAMAHNRKLRPIGPVESESCIAGFFLHDPSQEKLVRAKFDEAGIGISTMSDWDCPLHFPRNGATNIFRLAPHHYTSDETLRVTEEVIERL